MFDSMALIKKIWGLFFYEDSFGDNAIIDWDCCWQGLACARVKRDRDFYG